MMIEETLKTEVRESADVLVAGGGIAGIAAALAAARQGKRVILLERGFLLGGLATAGLVTIYLPLCDGYGRQVSFGLAEELLRLSVANYADGKRGYENWIVSSDPAKRGVKDPRFEVNFNPSLLAIDAERLLLSEGVKILYGTTVVATKCEGDRMRAVIVENKSGRSAIAAASFVDATGDADLAHLAGIPTVTFSRGNVLAAWYYSYGKDGYVLRPHGFCETPAAALGKEKQVFLTERRFTGLSAEENSELCEMAHAAILSDVKKHRAEDPDYQPVNIASIPELRMTRRIAGVYTLAEREVHTPFADSVGMVSDWRRRGPVFEVPFGTLFSPKMKNLIFAGRCTSVEDDIWDIMRVIPCCAVTGEAAGVAAALSDDFSALKTEKLQSALRAAGVKLHESELPPLG